jgi:hypothetical protein
MTLAGFPHSGISGSTLTCSSPKLFAAYRALHRLSVPRHPPCALLSLDRITSLALVRSEAHPVHLFANTHAWCSRVDHSDLLLPNSQYPDFQFQLWSGSASSERSTSEHFLRTVTAPGPIRHAYSSLQKGGDPAAGSPTATLLRLRPSHRARLRPLRPLRLRALPAPMA